jgi:hypothetical protein
MQSPVGFQLCLDEFLQIGCVRRVADGELDQMSISVATPSAWAEQAAYLGSRKTSPILPLGVGNVVSIGKTQGRSGPIAHAHHNLVQNVQIDVLGIRCARQRADEDLKATPVERDYGPGRLVRPEAVAGRRRTLIEPFQTESKVTHQLKYVLFARCPIFTASSPCDQLDWGRFY